MAKDPARWRPVLDHRNGAETPPPAPVPLADSLHARKVGWQGCVYASKPACGCAAPFCHRLGRAITVRDCVDCLK